MLKILEEARRKRGEPKALLEEIEKVSTDEGNEDLADAEKVAVEKAAVEILNKLASLEATLVRNSAHLLTHLPTY